MNFLKTKILSAVLLPLFILVKTNAPERIIVGWNDHWKFHFGGVEYADNPKFNDVSWAFISLLHTWNAVRSKGKNI